MEELCGDQLFSWGCWAKSCASVSVLEGGEIGQEPVWGECRSFLVTTTRRSGRNRGSKKPEENGVFLEHAGGLTRSPPK